MSQADTLVGQTLNGTYRIERQLGEGGHGAVYEASHVRLMRRFAIKLLRGDYTGSKEALARFEREAMVTSALDHPNIIDVTDFNYTDQGYPFLVMELLQGEDLEQRIQRAGRLDFNATISVVQQVSQALACAHARAVTHRDLKPQNIFLARRGGSNEEVVKVLDFGISKMVGLDTLTTTGALIGTPFYMAPEQVDEGGRTDVRTDVYAFGAITYQMLVGRPPLVAERLTSLLYKVAHVVPEPAATLAPVPGPVSEVIATALAKNPQERFASVMAFCNALEQAADVAPTMVTLAPPPRSGDSVPLQRLDTEVTGPTLAGPSVPMVSSSLLSSSTLSTSVGEQRARPETDRQYFQAEVTDQRPAPRRRGLLLPMAIAGAALGITGVALGVYLLSGPATPPKAIVDPPLVAASAGGTFDAETPPATADPPAAPDAGIAAEPDAGATAQEADDPPKPQLKRRPRRRPRRPRRPKRIATKVVPAPAQKLCTLGITAVDPQGRRLNGVLLSIGGRDAGKTPRVFRDLKQGWYTVRGRLAGYRPQKKRIQLKPGYNPLPLRMWPE